MKVNKSFTADKNLTKNLKYNNLIETELLLDNKDISENESACCSSSLETSFSDSKLMKQKQKTKPPFLLIKPQSLSVCNPLYNVDEYLDCNKNNNNNKCEPKNNQDRNSFLNVLTKTIRSLINNNEQMLADKVDDKKQHRRNRLEIDQIEMNLNQENEKIHLRLSLPSNCIKKEELESMIKMKKLDLTRKLSDLESEEEEEEEENSDDSDSDENILPNYQYITNSKKTKCNNLNDDTSSSSSCDCCLIFLVLVCLFVNPLICKYKQ